MLQSGQTRGVEETAGAHQAERLAPPCGIVEMTIHLVPVEVPSDYPRMAELLGTVDPDPPTAERLQDWEEKMPADKIRQSVKAVDESGHMLGYNVCEHFGYHLPRSFFVVLIVDPACRRHGVGSRLYDDALQFARAHDATRLETEVRDHEPQWRTFAEQRGFAVDRHIFESRLDLATFDPGPFAGVIESVEASGIRLTSLREMGVSEETKRELYEVNKRNSLDIPGSEGTFPSFEDFERFVFEASWFRPEGQVLALDEGRMVGLSALGFFRETNSVYTMHTGVLPEYRGRRIALALKLSTIRLARQSGAAYMRTNNDSQNATILAINQKLGYRPLPGFYRMLKPL